MAQREALEVTFDEFAEAARRREIRVFGDAYPCDIWYYVLGLIGDVGEVAERVRAAYRDDAGRTLLPSTPADQALMNELGDVLWYVNAIAAKLGGSLEELARRNGEKLADRERRGAIKGPQRPFHVTIDPDDHSDLP
jgi:NTP pyrophosphatase (non-canonical NTP hydrolase)